MSRGSEDRQETSDLAALTHAWDWFQLHAKQRMQCVNFFLVAVAFLVAAFVTVLKEQHYAVGAAIGLFAAWLSWWFRRLELRTKALVKAGERAMKPLQGRLSDKVSIPELEILRLVETPEKKWTSYGDVLWVLHWTTFVVFLIGSCYALYLAGVRVCLATCR